MNDHYQLLLTFNEALCLDAIRSGANQKAEIARLTKLSIRDISSSLRKLTDKVLVEKSKDHKWTATIDGTTRKYDILSRKKTIGDSKSGYRIVEGSSASRLLKLLESPMHGCDIVKEIGLSRQRIHQLTIRLYSIGAIRLADTSQPTFAMALSNDDTILLPSFHERIISSLNESEFTTISNISKVIHRRKEEISTSLEVLLNMGLVDAKRGTKDGDIFKLSPHGTVHWQRCNDGPVAEPVSLPVRSERIIKFLEYYDDNGPSRTRDLMSALGVIRTSANALVQYLKRKNLLLRPENTVDGVHALTEEGIKVLSDLKTRSKRPLCNDNEINTLTSKQ